MTRYAEKRRILARLMAMLLMAGGGVAEAQEQSDPVFNAAGFEEYRVYDGLASFERVDTATGNLILTFTDLVLPGDAGYDLRIERVYNGKPAGATWRVWDFGIAGVPMRVLLPATAPPAGPLPETHWPRFRTTDGAEHLGIPLTASSSPTAFRTKKFWVYRPADRRLDLPNGLVCIYDASGNLTEIRYPFGLAATITWQDVGLQKELATITQTVSGETRTVAFSYSGAVRTMTYGERVWTYTYSGIHLMSVQPPTGPGWSFTYHILGLYVPQSIATVTTPHGGLISYTWENVNFRTASGTIIASWALRQRATSSNLRAGTWTYTYSPTQWGIQVTVDGPGALRKIHEYRYVNGSLPVLVSTSRFEQGVIGVETESFEYQGGRLVDWRTNDQTLLQRHVVQRDGRIYTTTYQYSSNPLVYADYGQPQRVEETGDFTIVTTRVFNTQFRAPFHQGPYLGPYLPLLVDSETVADPTLPYPGEPFVKSAVYSLQTGFKTSETIHGIARTFTPDARGNLRVERDGVGKEITYSYAWGVVENTVTPRYTIYRHINPDSTIGWERRANHQTSYAYDGLFRRTRVTPPVGFEILTTFDEDGTKVTVGRGPSWTRYTLDGFGRVTRQINSASVQKTYTYDALGRKTFESLPFDNRIYPMPWGQGTTWYYDAFDRVRREGQPDNLERRVEYTGAGTVLIDEQQRTTVQRWHATGHPDNRRLASVIDAANFTFVYRYNALGKLRAVEQPGGTITVRSWTYHPGTELVATETHPEGGGTIGYQYDASGKLFKRVDTSGREFVHFYDTNGRLTRVDAPDANYTQRFDYDDADNRILAANNFVSSVFRYDAAKRLSEREDSFAGVVGVARTRYTYTGLDQVETLAYPSTTIVTYGYDSEGRLTRIQRNGGGDVIFVPEIGVHIPAYHPSGALLSVWFGNGRREDRTYDLRHRPVSVVSNLLQLSYEYYPAGNVARIWDNYRFEVNRSFQFQYDAVDRLTNYQRGPLNVTYEYDALGNRIRDGAGLYTYNPTTLRANHLTYGPNGQVLNDGQGTYTYTSHLMIDTATVNGATTTYRYDADHLRKVTIPPDGPVEFVVHGQGTQVLSEFSGVGIPGQRQLEWQRDYIYAGARLVATLRPTPAISVTFAQPSQQVSEAAGTAVVNVTVTTADGQPTTGYVDLQVLAVGASSSPATAGVDFQAATPATIHVPLSTPSGYTVAISVPIVNDHRDERTEQLEVRLSAAGSVTLPAPVHTIEIRDNDSPTLNDFNGDGISDIAVFRPSDITWYLYGSGEFVFGAGTDIPTPADYDGDGDTDIAVFRPSTGHWYVYGQLEATFGGAGDIPVPADYDGDGDADIAVFRPSTGRWYVYAQSEATFGGAGDIPVPADYDGDGDADIAVFRPSTGGWYVYAQSEATFGGAGDIPVPADYDGDGDVDVAVFRPSTGTWYVAGQSQATFGGGGDIPVPADYDGDGDVDITVFRPSTGTWYGYSLGQFSWGTPGDVPFCGWPCPIP